MEYNDRNSSNSARPTRNSANSARPTKTTKTTKTSGSKPPKKKKKKSGFSTFLRVLLVILLIACFAVVGAMIGAYFGIISSSEKLNAMSVTPSIFSSKIVIDGTDEVYAMLDAKENREYVTIDTLPPYLPEAFVAIEDSRFYSHNGIDPKGMIRSFASTVSGNGTQGASTITQQLIKNIRGLQRNTIKTKLQEQYLAVQYEKDMEEAYGSKKAAKDKILEIYLNTINLGGDYNGVQTAALHYFNKDASELTISESAVLAAITQYPSEHNPIYNPEKNQARQRTILAYMLDQGYITDAEYTEAINDDVYSRIADYNISTTTKSGKNTYYTDQVILDVTRDLAEKYGITRAEASNRLYNSGLEIRIPIDTEIQNIVDTEYLNDENFPSAGYKIQVTYLLDTKSKTTGKTQHFEKVEYVKSKDSIEEFVNAKKAELLTDDDEIIAEATYPVVQPQSSFVVIDNATGYVKAIEGGRGEKLTDLDLNRASSSTRQPGSTFKVLASYAPGIDSKVFTAGSVFDDVPFSVGTHDYKNWYSNPAYRGLSTAREGVRDSMNIVAVKAMDEVTVDKSFDYLLNFGFTTLVERRENPNGDIVSDKGLTTALGGLTDGVTNVELTAAYATIANNGEYRKPVFYTQVYDHDGNLILDNTAIEPKRVIRETSAYILTNMMEDVVTGGTGTAARFNNLKMPIAGKTGTTSDAKDVWFEGYTPYYTAGVWLGYDIPEYIPNDGSNYHKKLWSNIMEKIHVAKGLEYKEFAKPEGTVTATICRESGMIPTELCALDPRGNVTYTEIFELGTAPKEECTVHHSVDIDGASGQLATENCPSESIVKKVYIVRPSGENAGPEVADSIYQLPDNMEECTLHDGSSIDGLIEGLDYFIDPITGEKIFANGGNSSSNIPDVGTPSPIQTDNSSINRTEFPSNMPLPTPTKKPIIETPTPTPKPTDTPVPTPTEAPQIVIPDFKE